MIDSKEIHLLFHVPEGLEFIAAKDLEESLKHVTIIHHTKYSWEKKTGRVHLFCKVDNLNELRDYITNRIELLCIYSVTLVASESVIPADVFSEVQSTYDFITAQTKGAPWSSVIDEKEGADDITFRATFKKEQLKHKAPSQEIAGYIGYAFSDVYKHWKVKMTGYNYNIMSLWYQTTDIDVLSRISNHCSEKSVILLLGVGIPIKDQKQRNRLFYGRTSLNPCIAYCLAKLADPKPGQIVLDMCCGTGTIPIEGASRFKNTLWLGSEVKSKVIAEKAQGNLMHCKIQNAEFSIGDGRKLCYRPGIVDSIVSDWPWGLRENSYSQIKSLYPKFMKQMWNVLKPNGKAYIITQGHKIMTYVLKYDWCESMWKTEDIITIGIGGYDVSLYIFSKNPNPAIIPLGI
ncbi:hypothetical protein INT47_000599 [Mucor saturninus]|uniref:Ribosomal RNA large subunit methyltransferase K/L-like methyltransferase domain-containing protein n=1 Tax=Mucor saturninus TaxID=64648 RepID=A0A8H7RN18_9FUNG|nr:hypothetical protein INT47_000599 [Mucor saturninus]